jgi:hypothetical protein
MTRLMGHNNPPAQITAEIVRIKAEKVDIKLLINGEMHLLAWRRMTFQDEITVNGVQQHLSRALGGCDTLYGPVFARSR